MQEIKISNPDAAIYPPGTYDVIDQHVTYRLAQRPGAYVIIKYARDVLKLKNTEKISCPSAPPAVIERSYADVSFLVGLLIDKFLYHLPLYRLHQRLRDSATATSCSPTGRSRISFIKVPRCSGPSTTPRCARFSRATS